MKKYTIIIIALLLPFVIVSCAHHPNAPYNNTQSGAVIGAGIGALIGQAIGGDSEATVLGLAAGTILGALVGNAEDQNQQAARDAAHYGKPVVYYDEEGRAVEAIPEKTANPNCRTIRKRVWENGELVKETLEEVCGTPQPPVKRYGPPPPMGHYPPPVRYYAPPPRLGWWGWPFFPSIHIGASHYHRRHH